MKPLLYGAVLGLLWLLLGLPLPLPSAALIQAESPVTIAFILGIAACSYVRRSGRWTV